MMSIDTVKAYLGISLADTSFDVLFQLFLDSAISDFEGQTGLAIIQKSYEWEGVYTPCAFRLPVNITFLGSDEGIFQNSLKLETIEEAKSCEKIKIKGTVGYETIPADIQVALLEYIALLFGQKKTSQAKGMSSESIGEYSVQYRGTTNVPQTFLRCLMKYRQFSF